MKAKRNEDIFYEELVVLDYFIYQYKKELKKTTIYNNKEFKATKKTRLRRLRLEIEKNLKSIEDNLPSQWNEEV